MAWAPGLALFLVIGWAAAIYLHWPALTDYAIYKSDIRQTPHWAAYHSDTFRDDDLLIHYGAFNQSPVQNLIYWLGTYLIDMVLLTKSVAVISYGLCSGLFFLVGWSMFGWSGGALLGLFFTFFPDQFDYFAGGFSKMWMIPLLLIAVWILDKKAWKWLPVLMIFSAVAYPMTAVLIGLLVFFYLVLDFLDSGRNLTKGLGYLLLGSLVAIIPLMIKYGSPEPRIGPMTPGSVLMEMEEMYRGGTADYLPLPSLGYALSRPLQNGFVALSAILFFLILGRSKIHWRRSWTALLVASMTGYVLSSAFFMHFYIPNRYTRYSMAVLLALWQAANWSRVLSRIPRMPLRIGAVVLLLVGGAIAYRDTFQMGKDTGNRSEVVPLNAALGSLPPKVLIAGHPSYLDDVGVLARRSVLVNYKMSHPWFSDYYAEIKQRTEDTFRAIYSPNLAGVNQLHRKYGVTHLVLVKKHFRRGRFKARDLYVRPYNDFIYELTRKPQPLALAPPPPSSIVYEDDLYYVLSLPIRAAGKSEVPR